MKPGEQRRQCILQQLRAAERVTIEQAMELLDVSESTVRRLFAQLESEGLAIRTYGGIRPVEANHGEGEYSFETTRLRNSAEKSRIGAAAAELIRSGDIIYLDSGTTVMSLCAELGRKLAEEGGDSGLRVVLDNVTVFTHSPVCLNLLKNYVKVYLVGGEYRAERRDFCGYLTEEAIRSLRFTKCFIGADGYSEEAGLLASDFETARVNQLVAQNSAYRILLADSTKYGRSAMVCYAPFSEINCIVTDDGLPHEVCEQFRDGGIDVITT